MADQMNPQRVTYIIALIRALEQRAADGLIDDALADHIERLLGVGKPDPAGEAEYLSWQHAPGVVTGEGSQP